MCAWPQVTATTGDVDGMDTCRGCSSSAIIFSCVLEASTDCIFPHTHAAPSSVPTQPSHTHRHIGTMQHCTQTGATDNTPRPCTPVTHALCASPQAAVTTRRSVSVIPLPTTRDGAGLPSR